MRVENKTTFKGFSPYNLTAAIEDKVLINKAIFDITGSDVPWVVMANNKQERRERLNRAMLSFGLIFVSPLVILPFVNKFAMRKLTPKFFSDQYNAIKLSNKHLISKEATEKGLKELSDDLKIDFLPVIEKVGGDYEKLRNKIIKAKNLVLGFDFALVTGTFGSIGFFNAWQTKRKTGIKGYSAEMGMADSDLVKKRAQKYEKTEGLRFGAYALSLASLVFAVPAIIKHGLRTDKVNKLSKFIKKYAEKFDYNDAIFMSRAGMALSLAVAHIGVGMASRNKTELKDNLIRSSVSYAIFFGGDLLMASLLGQLSDKFLKTNIINRAKQKEGGIKKYLPPVIKMKQIAKSEFKRDKIVAPSIFWFNLIALSALMGFAIPYLINKIVKKDVSKDLSVNNTSTKNFSEKFLNQKQVFSNLRSN